MTHANPDLDIRDAAPGHRFHLYVHFWDEHFKMLRGPQQKNAIDKTRLYGESAKKQVNAIRTRQQALHAHHGACGLRISTTSTAPFATGLGNEHPIENGFAFLTPYGLPYLAGSGVKGILRRAMQELCADGVEGFSGEAINALFGPETVNKPEDAQRGALDFWDVFPHPAGGRLVVEIMTPHFGKYYQGSDTPHDSGQPVPDSFLAVPAKSEFDFHVVCQPSRLPAHLQTQWRSLLDQTFAHAFEWVGFGAKTSVGYGAMKAATAAQPAGNAAASGQAAMAQATAPLHIWPTAKLTLDASTGAVTAWFDNKKTVPLKNTQETPGADNLRTSLGEERANKLKKNKELKNVAVEVEPCGNGWQLKGLART